MTVKSLREWLKDKADSTEVMVETWDKYRLQSSGLKPLVLCIDCEELDGQIVLYGKEKR